MDKFAKLWPDALSPEESKRDLGYTPKVGLKETVDRILRAHAARLREGASVAEMSSVDGAP